MSSGEVRKVSRQDIQLVSGFFYVYVCSSPVRFLGFQVAGCRMLLLSSVDRSSCAFWASDLI